MKLYKSIKPCSQSSISYLTASHSSAWSIQAISVGVQCYFTSTPEEYDTGLPNYRFDDSKSSASFSPRAISPHFASLTRD